MTALPPCDCLNECGDDEHVRLGKAAPCPFWLRREESRRCERAMFNLVRHVLEMRSAAGRCMIETAAREAGVPPTKLRNTWIMLLKGSGD